MNTIDTRTHKEFRHDDRICPLRDKKCLGETCEFYEVDFDYSYAWTSLSNKDLSKVYFYVTAKCLHSGKVLWKHVTPYFQSPTEVIKEMEYEILGHKIEITREEPINVPIGAVRIVKKKLLKGETMDEDKFSRILTQYLMNNSPPCTHIGTVLD